jgi:hypothetical protein
MSTSRFAGDYALPAHKQAISAFIERKGKPDPKGEKIWQVKVKNREQW